LTANGGVILRDLLRKKDCISCLNGTINVEIFVIWGAIFSIYLSVNSYNSDPINIRNAVTIIVTGAFISRLMAYYFNIPNLKFRSEAQIKIHKEVRAEESII